MKQQVPDVMSRYLLIKNFLNPVNAGKRWIYCLLFAFLFAPDLQAQSNQEPELEREWAKQISTGASSYAATVATAIGPDQMPVVVGFSRDGNSTTRIVITKLNATGDVVWQQEYAGVAGSMGESPNQMSLDRQGNIYILGSVAFEEDNPDLLALKYSSDGSFMWAQHVNGGDGIRDLPESMAVSDAGEVYVTGTSQVPGGSQVLTAKFDAAGNIAWEKTFTGPEDVSDPQVQSIALDAAGDVVVAGNIISTERGRTLFVTKYSQADGQQVWVNLPEGGEIMFVNTYTADKLFIGESGNMYIAGTRAAIATVNLRPLLVKLDSEGNHVWSKFDETPSYASYFSDALLDDAENLLVLYSAQFGRSDTEAYVAKYNPDGEKVWGDIIVDAAGDNIYSNSLAMREDGVVAFTGFVRGSLAHEVPDLVTYLYAANGEQLDMDRYNQTADATESGWGIAFDAAGDLYVTGHAYASNTNATSLLAIKYATGGTVTPPPPAGSLTRAWAVTEEDEAGEVKKLLIGEGQKPVLLSNNAISAFSTAGQKVWESPSTINFKDAVQDKQNNIYVLTEWPISDTNNILLVTKYNSAGEQLWKYQYGQVHHNMRGGGLAVNEQGEVFVGSTVFNSGNDGYVKVIKLNADGTESWQANYEGNADFSNPRAAGLVLNEQGEVYVTGNYAMEVGLRHLFLLKYDGSEGSFLWDKVYPQSETATHYDPQELFIHSDGNLYIAGTTQSCCISHPTAFVLKADAAGNVLWNARAGDGSEIELLDASLGMDGSMAVVGTLYNPRAGINTRFVSKINSNGEQVWFKMEEGLMGVLAMDNGYVAATGTAYADLFVYVYDAQGVRVQQDSYSAEANLTEVGTHLAMDDRGNLYAAGTSGMPGSETADLLLVKYGSTDEPEEPCNEPVDVKLYLPPMAKRVGWQVRTTADFGSYILNEDTGVRWAWGDGSEPTISYTAFGTQRITGEHTYQKAGIYTIGLDFEESCLNPNSDDYTQQMVIFDPEAGFVTGSGEFVAPAQFGNTKLAYNFRIQYPNQYATEPVGSLRVMVGDKEYMASRTLDWLVIDGNRAAIQGTASISGLGNYKFVATMMDAGGPGPTDLGDGLRLQVWDLNAYGKLVFDSYAANPAKLDLHQPLPSIGFGQIIINGSAGELAEGDQEETEQAKAYPNPFVDRTTVAFKSLAAGAYEAVLYNTQGTVVGTLKSGTAQAAQAIEVEVDGRDLDQGLYFVKLRTGDKVQTVKLLLQR
ncbi:T9SS type A sorting domain-containing protein [uncultured Pontibacter sp.]|uniref:T9SS type A sorting domain-containing protein n=1 Tax=uncultured Pontibacter sp. TaxID=453356 RepID=UPI0026114D61|nr:T9SS type A sorting domain-containing protein [uncultured Pontibacter sp.]